MAREVQQFAVTVPAGTPKANPQVTNLSMPPRTVERLQVRVPPGPRGEVGFAIGAGNQPVLPVNAGAFVVADGEPIDWPLEEQIDSGAWQLFAYNTGRYAHTLQIRFLVQLPRRQAEAAGGSPPPIDTSLLDSGPATIPTGPVTLPPPPGLPAPPSILPPSFIPPGPDPAPHPARPPGPASPAHPHTSRSC